MPVTGVFPAFDRDMTARWDREWLHYLGTESMSPHLVPAGGLRLVGQLDGTSPAETFNTVLTADDRYGALGPLHIWCPGDRIVGRKVLEVGCGCGFLGKQLGLICSRYLGLDYSELALAIARGASPPTCEYRHVADRDALERKRGEYDAMVGREFFIHQNFDSALTVMGMAKFLLKPGGLVCADFYCAAPGVPQGIVHASRSALDPAYPSCGFEYSQNDVAELAAARGLNIVSTTVDRRQQRRFVIFEMQP